MNTDDQKQRVAAMRIRVQQKAAVVGAVLNTINGKKLMRILEEEFTDTEDLRGQTVYDTYHNLGARDVVVYLRTLQRIHDKTSEEI